MPMLIQVAITCVTETSIMLANSLAVTNSVSFNTLLSAISWSSNSCIRLDAISRFSLRYFAPLFLPLEVRRANVSFTCFATSSSLTSCLITGFLKRSLFLFLPACWLLPPCWLPPFGRSFPPRWKLDALLISTFSLLIRTRFFLALGSLLSFESFVLLSSRRISLIIASFISFF